jgi:hypothetical protein
MEDNAIRALLDIKLDRYDTKRHWVDEYAHPVAIEEGNLIHQFKRRRKLSYDEKCVVKTLNRMEIAPEAPVVRDIDDWDTIDLSK